MKMTGGGRPEFNAYWHLAATLTGLVGALASAALMGLRIYESPLKKALMVVAAILLLNLTVWASREFRSRSR